MTEENGPESDALNSQFNNVFDAIQSAFQQIVAAIAPAIEAVAIAAQDIMATVYRAYLEDGAIYGESHEGMMRWVEERGEIDRLRQKIEYLEQRVQAMVRDFKQMLQAKREQDD